MRRLATIRVRTTLAATVVVGLALLIVGLTITGMLRRTLTDGIDNTLEVRAETLVLQLDTGTSPRAVVSAPEEDSLTQIVGPGGDVVAASVNVGGRPALTDLGDGGYGTLPAAVAGIDRVRVHARATTDGSKVIVGTALEGADDAVAVVESSLLLGLPVVLGLVAAATWVVAGRTLSPVERIRTEVAGIGESELHRRVPEPRTHDEISRLAETMNEMLDRLEDSSRRQKRFVSDASHELRTPIATIRHRLEVALIADRPDWPGVASGVLAEDLRMQRLVEDLLWLARHDDERAERDRSVHGELVDVDEIALDEVDRHRDGGPPVLDGSGVGAGQIRGDGDEIRRVVANLVDNAIRHARRRVAVSMTTDGPIVRIIVEDDGGGIDPSNRVRVFERFVRVDESRTRADGGMGLGLAITSDIVAAHGGSISVVTSPGLGGARFVVTLPSTRQPAESAVVGPRPHTSAAVRSSSART